VTVETRPAPASIEPVGPTPKTTRDVLLHAALLIEERGWNQGSYQQDGRLCLLGAINLAQTGRHDKWNDMEATLAVRGVLPTSCGDWNDAPGRTAAEVIAALRAAADAK
jgi:hypothetical protein